MVDAGIARLCDARIGMRNGTTLIPASVPVRVQLACKEVGESTIAHLIHSASDVEGGAVLSVSDMLHSPPQAQSPEPRDTEVSENRPTAGGCCARCDAV